ncbi:MAG: hypothetical protein ACLP81_03110 [Acidimicrobiales bacterium]
MKKRRLWIRNKRLALVLGVGGLVLASFAFEQAWEARGAERPRAAKWLAI